MKIVNRIKALWDSLFNPSMHSSTKAEQDHYEAMYQDFLKSKPTVIGVDPGKPGADRTVYHQPARRQGKTAQQRFREQGVAAMAAARRGETPPTPAPTPVREYRQASSSPSFGAPYSNHREGDWIATAIITSEIFSSDTCDSSSSDSSSSDCSCGVD